MRLPSDLVIAAEKLTDYLLTSRPDDDKSWFLERAGSVASRPEELEVGNRRPAASHEAQEDGTGLDGSFWRVEGLLAGPEGSLRVVAIWLKRAVDGMFCFVTLKPAKEQGS